MNNWIFVVLIVGGIAIVAPLMTENIFAWTLTVQLVNKPFGDDRAWVEVRGPDGYQEGNWYNWVDIKTGPSVGEVSLQLSENNFPSGEQNQVCVSSKPLFNFVPNCGMKVHGSGNEAVRISLE